MALPEKEPVQTIPLKSWDEFEATIQTFFQRLESLRIERQPQTVSKPLFRGHVDASCKLETTLDRLCKCEITMEHYYRTILGVKPAIVSITEKNWDLPDHFKEAGGTPLPPPGYEFMIYLRHHGFPSPLLDWSRSPYVAAFFAFRTNGNPQDDCATIFSYVEWLGRGKSWSGSEPTMHGLGPYVVSHKRHYAQQCEYTICTKRIDENSVYCSHELAVSNQLNEQDQLIKYVIPKSERKKVLQKLEIMNVTAFSLFGSEESLAETLAYQELEKDFLR